ncbi:hypothetical protein CH298_04280 [Rhodococcoides fascians]|uniref:hypothetical protein n=1 Tax=Rhodococcoides fascians TaxID=1828 RepID=UPI000B9A2278|nr:hypothetical protein [Rhodococcus fascians]OZE92723.1 hypothetical protein CH303_04275 [Rhodococcus fascians]OZF23356.1 hypothetical protein CH298_04280 [Rhodococcus fascians]OZF25069.1 hypothetical protein CH297_04275 [Rhodococcus fascians]OZF72665.1 hypothetical protein CH308_04280 [Rhodococcus fascians]OZF73964.1 hypothetical protein CH307_04280 [Rhodococcus fascians]
MNLTQTQATIIDTLKEAGLSVQGWEKQNVVPPVVVVCPALPSVETTVEGVTHGKPFMTNWMIQIVAGRGTDDAVRDSLNDMIGRSLIALGPYMRDIEVESPKFTQGEQKYLGAEITASIAIDMKEE